MWNKKHVKLFITVFFIGAAGCLFFIKCINADNSVSDDTVIYEDITDTEDKADLDVSTEDESVKNGSIDNSANESSTVKSESIFVHVCGEVIQPGVYELSKEQRIIDLINMAGGFTDNAARDYINQAALLNDGQKIYIPSVIDVENDNAVNPLFNESDGTSFSTASESADTSSGKVNINTASLEELCTLPGIGQTRAKSIIEYREAYGKFSSIEAIMNVSGIKEGLFNKISEYLTI